MHGRFCRLLFRLRRATIRGRGGHRFRLFGARQRYCLPRCRGSSRLYINHNALNKCEGNCWREKGRVRWDGGLGIRIARRRGLGERRVCHGRQFCSHGIQDILHGQREVYRQQHQLIQGSSTSYFHLPLAAVEAASWPQVVVVEAVQQTSRLSFERNAAGEGD